ncbi:hypothetical protein ADL35_35035, partial [Streptomyces sp. NRRL WC-3753]
MSNAGLARRVNDLGAQRGLTLRYDKTSVARWVSKGMVPQGAAPHLIAAAIGQKLGRPVPLSWTMKSAPTDLSSSSVAEATIE